VQLGGRTDFLCHPIWSNVSGLKWFHNVILLFEVMYLAWCDFTMDLITGMHQMLCRSWKKCDRDPGNVYERSEKKAWAIHGCLNGKVQTNWDRKKVRQVKSKVKSMLIIFFYIKGTVHKEFILAGQTVSSSYYCEVLWWLHEFVQRLHPEFWSQNNWLLLTATHCLTSFFTREILTKNNMTVIPHPPYLPD
jgi:hypothetical protein